MTVDRKERWGKIYAFTTENIAGYLPLFGRLGPRVLCVCGSGDQLLNSLLFGGREFTLFDINREASFWLELKLAALKTLTLAEFRRFFLRFDQNSGRLSAQALNYETYAELRSQLPGPAGKFWEEAYRSASYKGSDLRNSSLFNNQYDENSLKLKSNLYLTDTRTYLKARTALQGSRIRFVESCVTELAGKLDRECFDAVFLSNIADYAESLFGTKEPLSRFIKEAVLPLLEHLNRQGQMLAAYVYAVSKDGAVNQHFRSEVDCPARRREVLAGLSRKTCEFCFPSVIKGAEDLAVVIDG
jgi:hypothetical protein